MIKEKISAFTKRISQATQVQLVVITYEMIIENLREAIDFNCKDETKEFSSAIRDAQKCIRNLQYSLDMEQEISRDLMSLYMFCNQQLVKAMIKCDNDRVEEVIQIIDNLRIGFDGISEQNNKPVMTNTEYIYAGLTYGRNSLNETSMGIGERGVRV